MRAFYTIPFVALAALGAAACAQVLSLDDYSIANAEPDVDAATDAASAVDAASDAGSTVDASNDASRDAGVTADSATDATTPLDAGPDTGAATDAGVDASDAGGTSVDANVDGGPLVRVRIVEPAQNGIANVGTDNLATLLVETTDFTLRPPGQCGATVNCGHAHVTIDGTNCNNVAAGKAYNIQLSAAGATKMNMALCLAGPTGVKSVDVELVADNHRPLAVREIATAPVNIVRGEVRLTSPLDEEVVTVPSSKLVPVTFAVSDFTLRPPGQCAGLANCGHARITVDGTACNAAGQAYNAIATATSGTNINLALCTSGHLGTKSVVIELVDDTGAALATPETNLADVAFVP